MKHHLITVAFLIAAGVCYVVGSNPGMVVFIVAGVVLESAFWLRLFRHPRVEDGG